MAQIHKGNRGGWFFLVLVILLCLHAVMAYAAIADYTPRLWMDMKSDYTDKSGNEVTAAIGAGPTCGGSYCETTSSTGVNGSLIIGDLGTNFVQACWMQRASGGFGVMFGDSSSGSGTQTGIRSVTGPLFKYRVDTPSGQWQIPDSNTYVGGWNLFLQWVNPVNMTTWVNGTFIGANATGGEHIIGHNSSWTVGNNPAASAGLVANYTNCFVLSGVTSFGNEELNELLAAGPMATYDTFFYQNVSISTRNRLTYENLSTFTVTAEDYSLWGQSLVDRGLTDGLQLYWDFAMNVTTDRSGNGNDITTLDEIAFWKEGTGLNGTGSYNWGRTATTARMIADANPTVWNINGTTILCWASFYDDTGYCFSSRDSSTGAYTTRMSSEDMTLMRENVVRGTCELCSDYWDNSDGSYHQFVWVMQPQNTTDTNISYYIDGQFIDSDTFNYMTNIGDWDTGIDLIGGRRYGTGSGAEKGNITVIAVWNRSLSGAEIATLWSDSYFPYQNLNVTQSTTTGTIQLPGFFQGIANITTVVANHFNISTTPTLYPTMVYISNTTAYPQIVLTNRWNGSIIHQANATYNSNLYKTTNGTIYFPDVNTTPALVEIKSPGYLPLNISVDLLENGVVTNSSIYQSITTVMAKVKKSLATLTYWNLTTPYATSTVTTGSLTIYPNMGTFMLTLSANGYLPEVTQVSFMGQGSLQLNLTQTQLNVTAQDISGTPINAFTLTLKRLSGDYTQSETNITTDGTATFAVTNGTYNLSIVANGYAFAHQVLTLNSTFLYFQENFTLLPTNTFNISFYDTVTHALLSGENMTLDIISEIYAQNYSTTTGNLSIELLQPANYTLRYHGTNYPEHFYWVALKNGSFYDLKLYLHSYNITTNISVTILDEFNNQLQDAQVLTKRYYLPTNSYVTQEILYTDIGGLTIMRGQLNKEYYRFYISVDGELKKVTDGAYLVSDTLTIPIQITTPVGEAFFTYVDDFSTHLGYDNASRSFTYVYSDSSNVADVGCLRLTEKTVTGDTVLNLTCVSGSSGTIQVYLPLQNDTSFVVDGYINQSGIEYYVGSLQAYMPVTGRPDFGSPVLYLDIILTIVFGYFGATFGASYMLTMAPLPTVIFTLFGMLNFQLGAVLGFYAIILVIAWGMVKQ